MRSGPCYLLLITFSNKFASGLVYRLTSVLKKNSSRKMTKVEAVCPLYFKAKPDWVKGPEMNGSGIIEFTAREHFKSR